MTYPEFVVLEVIHSDRPLVASTVRFGISLEYFNKKEKDGKHPQN